MIPPGGGRVHTFCSVERDGKELGVDLADTRKKKGMDRGFAYRLEDDKPVFNHYERISLLRKEWVY